MSEVTVNMQGARLEWHSIEETPPLHSVEYAGEAWLQSDPLLLVNAAGKMAIGYCQQEAGGRPEFEVGAGNERLSNISLWAMVKPPNQNPKRSERDFVAKKILGQRSPG
jgi:hypothetical protein